MPNAQNWWRAWAPYWEHLEDRHLSVYTTQGMEAHIESPVLIVGAGQGLIVEYLRQRGHRVEGIDLEPSMLKLARKRRGLELPRANAKELPFREASFKTVIIASGVADYQTETTEIEAIITEGQRALAEGGTLLVAFHQIAPKILRIYKKIGVVSGGTFHLRRIFDISLRVKENPFSCVKHIANWTGQNYLKTFAYWAKLGLTLPAELKEESAKVSEIFRQAALEQVPWEHLYHSVPEEIPLRDRGEIGQVLSEINIQDYSLHKSDDCLVVICPKSSREKKMKVALESPLRSTEGGEGEGAFLIETHDLTKKYKGSSRPAVDRLNLSIKKGIVFGILGPNGAGKTTTLMMLCGLLRPDGGEIFIAPRSPHSKKTRVQGVKKDMIIGYVPQDLALYPKLSGRDNLIFFGRLHKMGRVDLIERSEELLAMTGLADRADDLVGTYSTGMKRRLNLAVGILHRPAVVLMDEPTVGIDPQSRNRIYDTILTLKKEGVTILYTTHYMEEASRLCDRIAIIDNGTVLLEGNPRQIVLQHGSYILSYEMQNRDPQNPPPEESLRDLAELLRRRKEVRDVRKNGSNLAITLKKPDGNIAKLEWLEEMTKKINVELRLKNVVEPNLESLFLDLTGRRLRDSFDESGE